VWGRGRVGGSPQYQSQQLKAFTSRWLDSRD
jgi:hypothetical protein